MSVRSSVFFTLFMLTVGVGVGSEARDYITWKDLKVHYNWGFQFWGDDRSRVIVVDKTGNGDSLTIQGAINLVPENNTRRVKIHVLPGEYREKVHIPKNKPYISLIGSKDQESSTIISWHDKASDEAQQGRYLGTWNSASVTILSDYFCASEITFQECTISAVGSNSYALAAHRRSSATEDTGFSIVDSTITGPGEVYLGRAWGNYSRIVYSRCEIDIRVRPGGWEDWKNPSKHKTVEFAEYDCRGEGADKSTRVEWSKQLNSMEATPFLTTKFINGDTWLRL